MLFHWHKFNRIYRASPVHFDFVWCFQAGIKLFFKRRVFWDAWLKFRSRFCIWNWTTCEISSFTFVLIFGFWLFIAEIPFQRFDGANSLILEYIWLNHGKGIQKSPRATPLTITLILIRHSIQSIHSSQAVPCIFKKVDRFAESSFRRVIWAALLRVNDENFAYKVFLPIFDNLHQPLYVHQLHRINRFWYGE